MPKKGSRRFNLRRVKVAASTALGALATLDVVSAALTSTAADKYRVISAKLAYTWLDIAAVIDDGAQFGLAHSDYSAAEIEECLEATGNIDLGDKIAQEQGNRLVRQIGTFGSLQGAVVGGGRVWNHGEMIHTKLNWLMSASDTLVLWVRNTSGVVYTTGSSIGATGDLWIKD